MDEFETINLDIKECKICKQQTGEELISCILHENFSSSGENTSQSSCSNRAETFAHRICLERWNAVMKSSFYPQPKKTWKDRIMGLINAGQASVETWTPVGDLNHPDTCADNRPSCMSSDEQKVTQLAAANDVGHSVFSESKEAYRVEDAGYDHGQWRKSKVRIRSVDLEDIEHEQPAVPATSKRNFIRHTRSTCKYFILCDLRYSNAKIYTRGVKFTFNVLCNQICIEMYYFDTQ